MGGYVSRIVFQPPEPTYSPHDLPLISLTTKRGDTIPAFFIDQKSQTTLLFSHGNATDLGKIYEWFNTLSTVFDINVLAYDYGGYGLATGCASESNCYQDIDAAYEYLATTLEINPRHIVVYGQSLGSGPSCYLAERLSLANVRLAGLVLQCPFTSIFRVVLDLDFTLPGDMFSNIDRIENITCPLFVMHGRKDTVIPFSHGQALFMAARQECKTLSFWSNTAGHNDLEKQTFFFSRFKQFLNFV